MELGGKAAGVREDDIGLWGCACHVKEGLQLQQLAPEWLGE